MSSSKLTAMMLQMSNGILACNCIGRHKHGAARSWQKMCPTPHFQGAQLAKISVDWVPKNGAYQKKTGRTSAKPGEPGFRTRHRDSCTGQQFMTLHQEKCLSKKKRLSRVGPRVLVYFSFWWHVCVCVCVFGISMCFIMFCSSLLV